MAVFRVERNKNYTTMANYHFLDKSLSWKAKGILSNMLSLPNDWDYSLAGLATLSSDGMTATRTAIKELEEHGYLIRRPIRKDGKIYDWEYVIYEHPMIDNQDAEKPFVENQHIENNTQLNTKESNTKKNNINNINNIVEFLNQKAGTHYRAGGVTTKKHINARFAEGFTEEDFKTVIKKKCDEWRGTDMEKYLRPETLFGAKFESYLNAPAAKPKGNGTQIINGKEYEYINGKYYIKGGSGIAVDPYAQDELPF